MTTTPTAQPTLTPPPVNPLLIPKKVYLGQMVEIVSDNAWGGEQFTLDHEALSAITGDVPETSVTLIAECRQCAFSTELDADEDDHSSIEFRVWHHEQASPGHVIGYRTNITRSWES